MLAVCRAHDVDSQWHAARREESLAGALVPRVLALADVVHYPRAQDYCWAIDVAARSRLLGSATAVGCIVDGAVGCIVDGLVLGGVHVGAAAATGWFGVGPVTWFAFLDGRGPEFSTSYSLY